jgi:voltage-gated sodium channel
MVKNIKLRDVVNKLEGFFFGVIVLNAIVIYLQVSGYESIWLYVLDIICTLIFVIEMLLKMRAWGLAGYWTKGWDRVGGVLVILSLPSLFTPIAENMGWNTSILLIFRILRVLKFFRVMKIFPNFKEIMRNFGIAMRKTWAVLVSFALLILIFALINCSLFQDVAPEYFSTPSQSFYSVFKLFTVEGWYDIPDIVGKNSGPFAAHFVRLYFSILLIFGGIIGMSLINSIFVDAMGEDNDKDVIKKLKHMEKRMDQINKTLDDLNSRIK